MNDTPSKPAHHLTSHVKLLQKVALIHKGAVLILRREPGALSRPGAWDLPGGNSEWPADLQQSKFGLHRDDLIREVAEETGIELTRAQTVFANLRYCDTFFDVPKQIFTVILGWHVQLPDDFSRAKVTLSHEHSEAEWVSIEGLEANELSAAALDRYNFGDDAGQFVKDIILAQGQTRDSIEL